MELINDVELLCYKLYLIAPWPVTVNNVVAIEIQCKQNVHMYTLFISFIEKELDEHLKGFLRL